MDGHKSGLKGDGLVMPGTNENDALTLKETLAELYTAQNRLVLLINKLIKHDVINPEDLEKLVEINDAVLHGINYVEHVKSTCIDLAGI